MNLLARARGALQAGRPAQAERLFRRILSARPDFPEAHHGLGLALQLAGKLEEGLRLVEKSLALDPENATYHFSRGNLLKDMGRANDAMMAHLKAIELRPGYAAAYHNLANLLFMEGCYEESVNAFRKAIENQPRFAASYKGLIQSLTRLGRKEEIKEAYDVLVRLDPKNAQTQHIHRALSGEEAETAPRDYVVGLFDYYADKFDKNLVDDLRYRGPDDLLAAVRRACGREAAAWNIMDLGCGTGLCGERFRPFARKITGVDLSGKMLEQARKRGVYDDLLNEDITTALARREGDLDLAVSADVFIYVGDLEGVFEACARALRAGGLFAFTTEAFPGEGYLLRPSGRFAHSAGYIESLAERHGLSLALREEIVLRMEAGKPLAGHAFVLCKGKAAPKPAPSPQAPGSAPGPEAEAPDPARAKAIFEEAVLLHDAGHLAKAVSLYQQVLALAPDNHEVLHRMGVLANQADNPDAAAQLISAAIERAPAVAAYHTNLGLAHYARGDAEGAVGCMRRALFLDPESVDTQVNLANLLKLQGELDEAAERYRRILGSHPTYAEAHNNLAAVYIEQGREKEAEEHLRRALTYAPEYVDGRRNLANLFRRQGRIEEAAAHYRRLLKLRPGDAQAREMLAACGGEPVPG